MQHIMENQLKITDRDYMNEAFDLVGGVFMAKLKKKFSNVQSSYRQELKKQCGESPEKNVI